MDLLVRSDVRSPLDAEFEALGMRVLYCPYDDGPAAFGRRFRQIVEENGPYDVIHCHSLFNFGYVLRLARRLKIPVRLGHAHNARNFEPSPLRRFRVAVRVALFDRWWTGGLACSRLAAREIFGDRWETNNRVGVLYCGVDMAPFEAPPDPCARRELGIPDDAWVIGHVGRFSLQKNHPLIVEAAAEAMRRDPSIWTLLVGTGDTMDATVARVRAMDVGSRFVFAGFRRDIPRLLVSAMDVFLMPSLWEGLSLVSMEAQAAGLRILTSDAVSPEADAAPGMVERVSLAAPPSAWADRLLEWKSSPPSLSRAEALRIMRQSPFNIDNSVSALERWYAEALKGAR
jgi:glycosyltransferase involved in cell wall biosynthesis